MANIKQRKLPFNRWYNSHTTQVQKRLDSTLEPFRDRINNSLHVNSVKIIIYKRVKVGIVCSCSGHAPDPSYEDVSESESAELGAVSGWGAVTVVDAGSGTFGGKSNTIGLDLQPRIVEMGDLLPSTESSLLSDMADDIYSNPMGQATNCGICFMNGIVPSYQPVGYTTYILTHAHVSKLQLYTLDRGQHPYRLQKIGDGYVQYQITVPKYYKSLMYSVRNNTELLNEHLWFQGRRLTKAVLDLHRGATIDVEVRASEFSHLLMMFDLGANQITADMSEESNTLNYDQELTVSNLNLVFSQKVGMVSSQDIIYIPERNYVLKLTDANRKRTADKQMWEWSVSTRTVQRIEPLYNIHRGFTLR
jgi:hypothetical protein